MKRTFVDAGVLMAAAHGTDPVHAVAMEILDDADREFASSAFLKLEVLPKATYENRPREVEFYEEFFKAVTYWPDSIECVVQGAEREACTWGLRAMDALHVAAAASVGAEELVTTEKPTKPLHRVKCIEVVCITPAGSTT